MAKATINARQKDHQRLLNNLKMLQKLHTKARLCELLDISLPTWTNRMQEPWKRFSYDDLKAISDYCKVDFVELVTGELRIGAAT